MTFSIFHRIFQRSYSYGGQPILKENIQNYIDAKTKNERIFCETIGGSIVGIGETIFMPFDVLKIKKQTNYETFKNRSMYEIFKSEKISNYYRGLNITMARNSIAMGNTYFMNTLIREYYFNEKNQWNMNFYQYLTISFFSINSSLIVSSPLDVIKTRIQNKNFGKKVNSHQYNKRYY